MHSVVRCISGKACAHFFHSYISDKKDDTLSKQIELGKKLIENDSLRNQMLEAQRIERKPAAAMQIVELLERLTL